MLTSSIVIGLLLSVARRGDLRRLASMPLRGWWVFVVAFLLKFAITRFDVETHTWVSSIGPALHIVVYLMVLLPLVLNRELPWMSWVLAGTMLNFLVIAINGGRMPVLEQALEVLGKQRSLETLRAGADILHVSIARETALPWLGDWIPIPFPLASVVSPGDVLLAIGVILLMVAVTQGEPHSSPAAADERPRNQ